MDRATRALRFDAETKSVVVETATTAGSRGTLLVDIDVAEAIFNAFASAGTAPKMTKVEGHHVVAAFKGEAHEEEFHLVLQTASGEVATFAFAAPGKSQPQVADVSEAIRDALMRLFPRAH